MGVGERGACTLLGPEGPDAAASIFPFGEGCGGGFDSLGFLVAGCCRWVGGTARTLRTTQWTRASFGSAFGLVHIDDLKDH